MTQSNAIYRMASPHALFRRPVTAGEEPEGYLYYWWDPVRRHWDWAHDRADGLLWADEWAEAIAQLRSRAVAAWERASLRGDRARCQQADREMARCAGLLAAYDAADDIERGNEDELVPHTASPSGERYVCGEDLPPLLAEHLLRLGVLAR